MRDKLKRALVLAGLSRSNFVRVVTRLSSERLVALVRSTRSNPVLRILLGPLLRWLRAGPITIDAGAAAGLMVATPDIPMAHSQSGLIVRGALELPVQEALRRTLGPGAVLYDVGANIGFFSILGARLVGRQGQVYAVEPAPANASAIRRGVDANGFGATVTVIEAAAFASSGRGRLQVVEDASWSKLERSGAHELTEQVIEVDLIALDERLEADGWRPPDVIKIDVEGAELDALRGMRELIAAHRPAIICELHDTATGFEALMSDYGYSVENLEGPWPLAEAPDQGHALARPAPTA